VSNSGPLENAVIAKTGLNMEKNGSMDARTYVATHTLKNGVEITIRAIRSEDKRKLLEAFKQLDRSSIYTRFFGHKKSLSEAELEQATNLDFHATVALVATMGQGEDEAIVGGGRYSTGGSGSSPSSAEVAFTVEEDYQGLGIASLLFGHLVRIARAQGLSRLEADVLAVNQPMLKVFRRSGLPMDQRAEGDTVHIVLELDSAGQ
jgi:GNAT superfamily N-acetyltransferase